MRRLPIVSVFKINEKSLLHTKLLVGKIEHARGTRIRVNFSAKDVRATDDFTNLCQLDIDRLQTSKQRTAVTTDCAGLFSPRTDACLKIHLKFRKSEKVNTLSYSRSSSFYAVLNRIGSMKLFLHSLQCLVCLRRVYYTSSGTIWRTTSSQKGNESFIVRCVIVSCSSSSLKSYLLHLAWRAKWVSCVTFALHFPQSLGLSGKPGLVKREKCVHNNASPAPWRRLKVDGIFCYISPPTHPPSFTWSLELSLFSASILHVVAICQSRLKCRAVRSWYPGFFFNGLLEQYLSGCCCTRGSGNTGRERGENKKHDNRSVPSWHVL